MGTQRLGLDGACVSILKGLPEDAQCTVMLKFDPSRTKDGNIAARLESFARSVVSKGGRATPHHTAGYHGDSGYSAASWVAVPAYSHYKPPPWSQAADPYAWPPAQKGAPAPWHSGHYGYGHGQMSHPRSRARMGPLDAFVQQWGLNSEAAAFLADLPEEVSSSVFNSFDAAGTKDGNIWGRLFGFVRSVWSIKNKIGKDVVNFVKTLSEEQQMAVMVGFDPAQAAGSDPISYIQDIADNMQTATSHESEYYSGDDGIAGFARTYNLDDDGIKFLESLSEEVCSKVIADFQPGGTKDGNVFARLQSFARCVEKRHKRQLDGGDNFDPGTPRRNAKRHREQW